MRLPFTYLNLPAARMLPGWLPEDSTSGRGHDDEVYTGLDPVSRLGSAMEKATGKRRFFRRTSQWTITMLRVGAALVGCGQWTWVMLFVHIDCILHLVERESIRNSRLGPSTALLYDELRRLNWETRTRQGDPLLTSLQDLEKEAARVDEALLEIARTRVQSVLKKSGLSSLLVGGESSAGVVDIPDSVKAKMDSAKAALAKRTGVPSDAKQLAREQQELGERMKSLRQSQGDFRNARERHRDSFAARKGGEGPASSAGHPYLPPAPPVPYSQDNHRKGGKKGGGRGGTRR